MFDTGSVLQESSNFVWDNTNKYLQLKSDTGAYQLGASSDVILTRKAAASLRLGASDAASPIAQTIGVQSVIAGTTNTAGANLTINGSQGTGTGAGGSLIFQVAPAGTTGTAQNALATALTIANDTTVYYGGSTTYITGKDPSGPFLILTQILRVAPGNLDIRMSNNVSFGFTSASSGTSIDTILTRRAAANLRFGASDAASPVAQTLSVQSVVAGTTNTAGANLTITGSQGTGTGVGGDIIFQVAPAGTTGTAQNALAQGLRIYSNQTVVIGKAYTVTTLPAAGTQGRKAWVTDALSPTFLGTLTGGGAVVTPVFDNGTAWVAG